GRGYARGGDHALRRDEEAPDLLRCERPGLDSCRPCEPLDTPSVCRLRRGASQGGDGSNARGSLERRRGEAGGGVCSSANGKLETEESQRLGDGDSESEERPAEGRDHALAS